MEKKTKWLTPEELDEGVRGQKVCAEILRKLSFIKAGQ
ncbi:MAG: hypothetical protein SBU_000613 [Candidatus Syntrophoarchaeum butanivorans]|uniref:Uncharacterized protein n=1 Tax=Candidatus Syntropharchaeum butanivorans TaxID=1839936 RepID=A0A1F2P7S1_9EURY|nr:MAG: hypothetical protein SBU_000613 [Candidatus Syntrophoarchaeum butanivorans]